jgi:hypothetical protein
MVFQNAPSPIALMLIPWVCLLLSLFSAVKVLVNAKRKRPVQGWMTCWIVSFVLFLGISILLRYYGPSLYGFK